GAPTEPPELPLEDLASTLAPRAATEDLWAKDERLPLAPGSPPAPTPGAANRAALTQTGALMGTPAYMAPELAHGARRATPASDMFAFGLMSYEMLAGRPAFSSPAVLLVVACGSLPGVDAAVVELVLRCLDELPERRPSAEEMAAGFANAGAG